MSTESLQQLIRQVRSGGTPITLTRSSRLVDEVGLRSIEIIALIAKCEQTFGVDLISQSALLARVRTVGDLSDLIEQLRTPELEI